MEQDSRRVCRVLGTECGNGGEDSISLNLSLQPGFPFTLSTAVYFKDVQGGDIFCQDDFFKLSLCRGILYLSCCGTGIQDYTRIAVACISPDEWCILTLAYDCTELSVYLRGWKAGAIPCSPQPGFVAGSPFSIGGKLAAYFRSLFIYPLCLHVHEVEFIHAEYGYRKDQTLACFDFDRYGTANQSPGQVALSGEARRQMVTLIPIEQIKVNLDNERYGRSDNPSLVHALGENGTVNCVGMIRIHQDETVSGCISLDTPVPAVWEIAGAVNIVWREVRPGN